MSYDFFVTSFVTLITVVDPVGLAPSFLALTHHLSSAAQRRVASRAALFAGVILIAATLFGGWLLHALAISIPAFRIAGGLLLLWIAFEMVFEKHLERQTRTAEQAGDDQWRHIAAFPLAMPLMAGPGALTATVLLSAQAASNPLMLGWLIVVIVIVVAACFCAFVLAEKIGRLIGVTGNVVLCRLLGIILSALAVQFVIDGVLAVIASR